MDTDVGSGSKPNTPDKTPQTEDWRTPEEIAGETASLEPLKTVGPEGTWLSKLKAKWPPDRRELLVSAAVIIVCGSIVGFILNHTAGRPQAAAKAPPIHKPKPKETTVPSALSGLPVDPATNQRPVTAVMVENSLDSRPQSGLSQAGVVFEAIAEGGITRFMALYQDTAPGSIGPVRSARPYYVQWAMGFDASYAHVGGSPEALADIKAWGVRDLDQFHNAGAYQRITSRVAPHNVYSSLDTLTQLGISKGYTSSKFTSLKRKKAAPAKEPNVGTIDISISGPAFSVHYDYNRATHTYDRSLAGAPHVDANGNVRISPAVVVVLVMPYGIAADGHSQYGVIGSGQALIFQDGVGAIGTWSKTDAKTQLTLSDAAGKPLGLDPGQTWITAVSGADKVNYRL